MTDAPLTILIADDEPAHIEAIRRAFQAARPKFVIKSVATLREYLELAAADPPDIAILDLNFQDGCAVTAIHSPLDPASLPILIMTSHGDEAKAVEAIKSGALDYIVKSPEAFANMPRAVERALSEWAGIRERIAAERSSRALEEERRLFSGRILRAREENNRMLATALHDAIGSMLVGLSSSLLLVEEEIKAGDSKRAIAKVAQTKKLVKGLAAMMKAVCVDIWPPALAVSGLSGTLSELLSVFGGRTRIKTRHSIDLPDDGRMAGSALEIIIYRLVQEALQNAAKHSKAQNLELIISHDDDKVMVSVSDDGRGFDAGGPPSKSGLGLRIIQEEAESVGGGVLIDSKPGRGTLIKAQFPRRPSPDPEPAP